MLLSPCKPPIQRSGGATELWVGGSPSAVVSKSRRLLVWRRCLRLCPKKISKTIETLYRAGIGPGSGARSPPRRSGSRRGMHEAFAAALESWPQTGIPDSPRPWLISTARFKAIDVMRRRSRFDGAQRDLVAHMESRINDAPLGIEHMDDKEIEDDRLRLIFTCCHPALPPDGQRVALTLREICGLTTEEIARAFLDYAGGTGAAYCARQDEDSRDTDSLQSADSRGIAGATGRGASGHLSRLQ